MTEPSAAVRPPHPERLQALVDEIVSCADTRDGGAVDAARLCQTLIQLAREDLLALVDTLQAEVAALEQRLDQVGDKALAKDPAPTLSAPPLVERRIATATAMGHAGVCPDFFDDGCPFAERALDLVDTLQQQHADRDGVIENHAKLSQQAARENEGLRAQITDYEKRPWPGCRMLSQGEACMCSLCQASKQITVLQQHIRELEREVVMLSRQVQP